MKITKKWLKKENACQSGFKWFCNQNETNGITLVKTLIDVEINWASWLIVRLMTHKQNVQCAIYAAEQVIELFEKKYPKDDRPRKAIEAAKKWVKNPSEENANAAADAAANAAADAAANAAYVTYAAAYAAAHAAYAANAAAHAANAAAHAAYAANAAADAAAYVKDKKETKKKILFYGIKLLNKKKGQ